jgi:hypothetical protein
MPAPGIVELREGVGSLIAELPGVTDAALIGRGDMFAVRGGGPGLTTGALFRVSRGGLRLIADLYAFEAARIHIPLPLIRIPAVGRTRGCRRRWRQ